MSSNCKTVIGADLHLEMILNFQEIIHFWFTEIDPKSWWTKSSNFDESLRLRFAQIHTAANSCELWQWRKDPLGRLAEILILDQFSRNMFRDLAGSFASDPLALALAQEAVACGADFQLPTPEHRLFLYMPFMHSESRAIHQEAVRLFSSLGLQGNLDFEMKHKAIIDQFGRYPHRNRILGRKSTPEEIEFLKIPGSSF